VNDNLHDWLATDGSAAPAQVQQAPLDGTPDQP